MLGALFSVGPLASASTGAQPQRSSEAAAEGRGSLDDVDDSEDPPLPEGDTPRPSPGYRSPPSSVWQRVAWVPRVLLAPAYVATDLVARPIIAIATVAERNHWPARLHDFFTFGPQDRLGLFPAAYIDTGFRSRMGAYFFWKEMWRASDLHLRVLTAGVDQWDARGLWQWEPDGDTLRVTARYSERDDDAFHGYGPTSSSSAARFGERTFQIQVRYKRTVAERLVLSGLLSQQSSIFEPFIERYGEASLGQAIAAGRMAAPPSLDSGFVVLTTGLQLDFEGRRGRVSARPRQAADYAHVGGSGIALHGELANHVGLERTRAEPGGAARLPAWLSYGAMATGTLDLTGTQRRLGLELYAAFTDPLPGAAPVPFTQAVNLGGSRPLRGFPSRRFVDRSAAVATLRYRWPVWTALDGTLHAAVGNVFGPRLSDLDPEALRSSFGVGVTTAAASTQAFEVLLAFGTRPLGAGAGIESARLAAGTTLTF
jgi:hypothetical protein